jgi:predicted component of type VI protein secretion system
MRAEKVGKFCTTVVMLEAKEGLGHQEYIAAVEEHMNHLLQTAMGMAVLAAQLKQCAAMVPQ